MFTKLRLDASMLICSVWTVVCASVGVVCLSVSDSVQNQFLTRQPQVGKLKKSNTEIQFL